MHGEANDEDTGMHLRPLVNLEEVTRDPARLSRDDEAVFMNFLLCG